MPAARIVPANGPLLARILETTYSTASAGLSHRAFAQFEHAQMKLPWASRHQQRIALVAGGDVLASARLYDFAATLDGRRVAIRAIGSLATDPAHVDTDHARVLTQHVLEKARHDGVDTAMVFAEPEPLLGGVDGFDVLPVSDVEIRVVESSRYGAPMTMVRGGDDTDIPAIADMGQRRAASCRFHLERDTDFVAYAIARKRLLAGLTAAHERELEFVVTEEGRTAVAYVVISRAGHAWTMEECGDRDPTGARVGAILQGLIAREPAQRRPVIRGWLPPGFLPPQLKFVSTTPSVAILVQHLQDASTPARLSAEDVLYWRNDVF